MNEGTKEENKLLDNFSGIFLGIIIGFIIGFLLKEGDKEKLLAFLRDKFQQISKKSEIST